MLNNDITKTPASEVAAVRKALEILCQFDVANPVHSVTGLSGNLAMPKSTVHNLLRTLERLDFVRRDPGDRRYRLGPRVFELGMAYSNKNRLACAAYPLMRKLAAHTKETVKIGVPSNSDVVILAAIESPFQLHTRGDAGLRAPLHCTGLGKAILATFDDQEVEAAVAPRGLYTITPNTITTLPALRTELSGIRVRGYALDVEEHELGVVCAAAAVTDPSRGVVAALSVSAPASRMDATQLVACAELVARAAKLITASLQGFSRAARHNSEEEPNEDLS
jgi:IclR family transcriptional regulator, KDG regulon repressor